MKYSKLPSAFAQHLHDDVASAENHRKERATDYDGRHKLDVANLPHEFALRVGVWMGVGRIR